MKGLMSLYKKELKEQLRTNRIIIVAGVFLFFGISLPLMTRYLPEILEMSGAIDVGSVLPPPTAIQSLAGYVSNMLQLGTLMIILVAMGAIAKERESGTAALVLSKPVDYSAFVVAKFKAVGLTTLIGVILGWLVCWGYTVILFEETPALGFLYQNVLMLAYLSLAIAVTMLFSSFFRSQLAAGALGLVTIVVLSLASNLPWVGKYLPGELISWGNSLLMGESADAAWWAVVVTIALIVFSLFLAWTILKRKEV